MITAAGRALLDKLRIRQGLDSKLPWGGRSPRGLTRAALERKLRLEAAPLDEADARIDEQYRRFTHGS